jgi:ABC-type phosphate transport system substrate-binding protein
MRLRVHATVVTCLASLFLLFGGCEQPADTALAAPSSESTTNISAAGSSFAAPMFNKWFELYATDHPDLKLGYDSVGSGEGIDRFLAGTVDIGATDAPLRPDEAARAAGGYRQIPPGASSYPIVTNTWALLRIGYDHDPAQGKAVKDLIRWVLTDGQSYADALWYVPLPDNVVQAALTALQAIGG